MLLSAIIAFFSAAGIYFIFQCVKQALLRRIAISNNLRVDTIVSVCGEAPELEMLVRRLKSCEECGEIYLRSCGADKETALLAEKLAHKGLIKIID
ncbi:MAG: hypothetical protein E7420_02835 [Ruminococcaceae bacterium]|nr:hypothetical protein [Oscillospiraceae bacterium]